MDGYRHDGLTFPVIDGGGHDTAATVVLLHGFPQPAASWAAVATALRAHGLRTLVPTQRGYATTNTPSGRRRYRMTDLVGDVVGLLDAAGLDRVHLVGHDWGGAVAWAVAAWHPARIASLTVVSTPHPAALATALRHRDQARRSWYIAAFQLPVLPELVLPWVMRRSLRSMGLPPAMAAEHVAARRGRWTGPLHWYRALPFRDRRVGPVGVPTTYVWGRHDPALGRAAALGTADRVRADYRFVELDAGHFLPETRPADVADAILQRVRDVRD